MEPEGSSLYSQEPTICPYPEPDKSSPCFLISLLEAPILIVSSHLRLHLPGGLFTPGFPITLQIQNADSCSINVVCK